MYKVMLIDDEDNLQQAIEQLLVSNGYAFCGAKDAESGLDLLASEHPDLLLLDVMLPGTNGFDLCARIREQGRRIPVIFLSAKCDIVDKSIGFKAGADDYLVKPFQPEELSLRIKAHLRRRSKAEEDELSTAPKKRRTYQVGELELLFGKYEVRLAGKPVSLSSREFELLELLATDPGSVFTRDQIMEHVWGAKDATDPNSVTVFVRKIREKIEDDPSKPRYLMTVWRVGYKLADRALFESQRA